MLWQLLERTVQGLLWLVLPHFKYATVQTGVAMSVSHGEQPGECWQRLLYEVYNNNSIVGVFHKYSMLARLSLRETCGQGQAAGLFLLPVHHHLLVVSKWISNEKGKKKRILCFTHRGACVSICRTCHTVGRCLDSVTGNTCWLKEHWDRDDVKEFPYFAAGHLEHEMTA